MNGAFLERDRETAAWKDAPDRFWPMSIEFIRSTTARERVEA